MGLALGCGVSSPPPEAAAVLAASLFRDGNDTVREAKDAPRAEGFPIRR